MTHLTGPTWFFALDVFFGAIGMIASFDFIVRKARAVLLIFREVDESMEVFDG